MRGRCEQYFGLVAHRAPTVVGCAGGHQSTSGRWSITASALAGTGTYQGGDPKLTLCTPLSSTRDGSLPRMLPTTWQPRHAGTDAKDFSRPGCSTTLRRLLGRMLRQLPHEGTSPAPMRNLEPRVRTRRRASRWESTGPLRGMTGSEARRGSSENQACGSRATTAGYQGRASTAYRENAHGEADVVAVVEGHLRMRPTWCRWSSQGLSTVPAT